MPMGYHGENINGPERNPDLFLGVSLWEIAEEKRSLEQCRC